MKSRNREVNIFNMSLLDILCGALGAFCFMMLGLFPYYSPAGPARAADAVQAQRLKDEIERMQRELAERGAAADSDELRRQLAEQSDLLQQLQQQLDQQTGTINDLDRQVRQVGATRNPISVAAFWGTAADVDLFVESHVAGAPLEPEQRFDPKREQGTSFTGDLWLRFGGGPATEIWSMRDTPTGRYEIYYKLRTQTDPPVPVAVAGWLLVTYRSDPTNPQRTADVPPNLELPIATLTRAQTGVHVATVTVAENGDVRWESRLPGAPAGGAPGTTAAKPTR